jgi:rod shape-determining protein MreC
MQRMTLPVKVAIQRFAYVLLMASAVALMLFGKSESSGIQQFRTTVFDIARPVLEVLSQPAISFNRVVNEVRALSTLRVENSRLREENARLHHWKETALRLEQEVAGLSTLLAAPGAPESRRISARVIGDSGGPFVRTMLLAAGSRDGVSRGQAVVAGDGLVGRIAEAGARTARILLISDLNSRVPVVIESSRYRGILEGDNTESLRLGFLPAAAEVGVGDRVVTSGHGGVFPPDLPVGVVTSVADGIVRVQPLVQFHRLEYVQVVDYAFPRPPSTSTRRPSGGLQ